MPLMVGRARNRETANICDAVNYNDTRIQLLEQEVKDLGKHIDQLIVMVGTLNDRIR